MSNIFWNYKFNLRNLKQLEFLILYFFSVFSDFIKLVHFWNGYQVFWYYLKIRNICLLYYTTSLNIK